MISYWWSLDPNVVVKIIHDFTPADELGWLDPTLKLVTRIQVQCVALIFFAQNGFQKPYGIENVLLIPFPSPLRLQRYIGRLSELFERNKRFKALFQRHFLVTFKRDKSGGGASSSPDLLLIPTFESLWHNFLLYPCIEFRYWAG